MSVAPELIIRKETGVDADPVVLAFVRKLDATFGAETWSALDDPRYCDELDFRPVEVVAPVDYHVELFEKANRVESEMRDEFDARVLVFVVAPEE